MAKFTDAEVVDFVMAKTEGADAAEVLKHLTESTWTVRVAIEDGELMGVMCYKFRTAYVDVTGEQSRILGLWI